MMTYSLTYSFEEACASIEVEGAQIQFLYALMHKWSTREELYKAATLLTKYRIPDASTSESGYYAEIFKNMGTNPCIPVLWETGSSHLITVFALHFCDRTRPLHYYQNQDFEQPQIGSTYEFNAMDAAYLVVAGRFPKYIYRQIKKYAYKDVKKMQGLCFALDSREMEIYGEKIKI